MTADCAERVQTHYISIPVHAGLQDIKPGERRDTHEQSTHEQKTLEANHRSIFDGSHLDGCHRAGAVLHQLCTISRRLLTRPSSSSRPSGPNSRAPRTRHRPLRDLKARHDFEAALNLRGFHVRVVVDGLGGEGSEGGCFTLRLAARAVRVLGYAERNLPLLTALQRCPDFSTAAAFLAGAAPLILLATTADGRKTTASLSENLRYRSFHARDIGELSAVKGVFGRWGGAHGAKSGAQRVCAVLCEV